MICCQISTSNPSDGISNQALGELFERASRSYAKKSIKLKSTLEYESDFEKSMDKSNGISKIIQMDYMISKYK